MVEREADIILRNTSCYPSQNYCLLCEAFSSKTLAHKKRGNDVFKPSV